MTPAEQVLRHFRADHLPEPLRSVSTAAGALAHHMHESLEPGPELTAGLRKLLEAKDCLVRAALEPVQPFEPFIPGRPS